MKEDREAAPAGAAAEGAEAAGDGGAGSLLELVIAEHAQRVAEAAPARIDGVVVGRLAAIGPNGEALVEFAGNPSPEPAPARAMIAIGADLRGRDVALLFEGGDPRKPVVMGLMHAAGAPAPEPAVEADADGERLVFEADKEIVLRCGAASITLTRAGKILIQGAYVLTRSSGVNRIQGGSVQIN